MKKTPNQIREELRRQIAKQHNDEIENLKRLKDYAWEQFKEIDKEACQLKKENNELKEKVAQLEDWNRRLMEFMDMNDEERKAAIQEYQTNAELSDLCNNYLGKYIQLFGGMYL